MFYPCPCCGYKTLSEEERGSYEICSMCGWEDDYVQLRDPDLKGGANHESLREAQQNFIEDQLKDKSSSECDAHILQIIKS